VLKDIAWMLFVWYYLARYLTGLTSAEKHIRPLLKANGLSEWHKVSVDVPKKHDWWD